MNIVDTVRDPLSVNIDDWLVENIGIDIARNLCHYGIEKKIGYFTLDKARNNDTCIQELGLFNLRSRQLRCTKNFASSWA